MIKTTGKHFQAQNFEALSQNKLHLKLFFGEECFSSFWNLPGGYFQQLHSGERTIQSPKTLQHSVSRFACVSAV